MGAQSRFVVQNRMNKMNALATWQNLLYEQNTNWEDGATISGSLAGGGKTDAVNSMAATKKAAGWL